MGQMMREDFSPRKKRLIVSANPLVSGTIEAVRDPQNPVKLRAENRARVLGTTLHQIYNRIGVSRNYLTYAPKNGWREDKLRLVADALDWSIDQLLHGPEDEQLSRELAAERAEQDINLLELAIEAAVDLLREEAPEARTSANVGRLSRLIHETLVDHLSFERPETPTPDSIRSWGRALRRALSTRSIRS